MRRTGFLVLGLSLSLMPHALPAAGAGQDLSLTLVALTSPVRPGQTAHLTVQTAPDTQCIMLLQYQAGGGTADLAVPKRADAKGLVGWTWRVDPKAAPGTWPIIVHCTNEFKGNGIEARLELPFVVRI